MQSRVAEIGRNSPAGRNRRHGNLSSWRAGFPRSGVTGLGATPAAPCDVCGHASESHVTRVVNGGTRRDHARTPPVNSALLHAPRCARARLLAALVAASAAPCPMARSLRSLTAAQRGARGQSRLDRLLVVADLLQGRGVDDVGHRTVAALLTVGARGLPPAGGPDAQLLAQQREEDPRLLVAVAGQRRSAGAAARAGRHVPPDRGGVAAVVLDHVTGQLPGPVRPCCGGTGARPAGPPSPRRTPPGPRRRPPAGSSPSVPSRSAIRRGPAKAVSIGICWSSSMPDEQRERVAGEQRVRGGILGQVQAEIGGQAAGRVGAGLRQPRRAGRSPVRLGRGRLGPPTAAPASRLPGSRPVRGPSPPARGTGRPGGSAGRWSRGSACRPGCAAAAR